MSTRTGQATQSGEIPGVDSPFGQLYRANVGAVSGFFARRCADPQTVADLTSETFVRALGSYRRFDPRRGTERAWLIGISHNVFRRHVGAVSEAREMMQRLSRQLELGQDDIDELAARIDAQSTARALLERVAGFPEPERVALELVDVMQMSPKGRPAIEISSVHPQSGPRTNYYVDPGTYQPIELDQFGFDSAADVTRIRFTAYETLPLAGHRQLLRLPVPSTAQVDHTPADYWHAAEVLRIF